MQATNTITIDWLSLSPRTMARVMEVSTELGITPQDAFELMSEEAAACHADLPPSKAKPRFKPAKQPA